MNEKLNIGVILSRERNYFEKWYGKLKKPRKKALGGDNKDE